MQVGHRNVFPMSEIRRNSLENLSPQLHGRNIDGTRSLRRLKPPQIRKLCGTVHFHYDNVELGPIEVYFEETLQNDALNFQCRSNSTRKIIGARTPFIYFVTVRSNGKTWHIKRSYQDFFDFDKQLHRCVYDRRISKLAELSPLADVLNSSSDAEHDVYESLSKYLKRFSDLAGSLITCFPVLKWLELDNRGNHLMPAEETPINTPAVAAAYVVRDYLAQANNELTLNIGDIISVIDMPPPSESFWWRGKLTIGRRDLRITIGDQPSSPLFEVGFFPSDCVQLFGNRVQILPPVLRDGIYDKPVFQRRGKLIAFFRAFLATRPSRRRLKESGILMERVFGCDLAEHLQNTGQDVPLVLKACCKVIESHGVVDGIYRLSGALSNIQKLRAAFDDNKEPDLLDETILRDIHCVASLLKMYFRELPNPLLTYPLYSSFVDAAKIQDHSLRILRLHDVVQQLPPPHFRTAEYLIKHLAKIGDSGFRTGMNFQNLAIVWAPNLLRCKELENAWESAGVLLRNVNVQAVIVEYLIRYVDIIFSRKLPVFASCPSQPIHGGAMSSTLSRNSRPQSLTVTSPNKLIDLEEAQRKLMAARFDKLPPDVGLPDLSNRKCIDVNGGPAALPVKYHTIIEIPPRLQRKGSSGWKSLFSSNKSSSTSSYSSSSKALASRHQKTFHHLPVTTKITFNEDQHSFLRHVKSAESLISSNSCPAELQYNKHTRRGANRRSLRETTPLREEMPVVTRRAPSTTTTTMKPTDLDAAYSSNESQLFGALHPRYDQRRTAGIQQHRHVPYAISVHVNLERISPTAEHAESVVSSPRCESSLICYETSLVSAAITPLSGQRTSWDSDEIPNEVFASSSTVNAKKIAKVQPMTGERNESNNNSINVGKTIDSSTMAALVETSELFADSTSPTTVTADAEFTSCHLTTDSKISSLPSSTSPSSVEEEEQSSSAASLPATTDRATSVSSLSPEDRGMAPLVPPPRSVSASSPSASSTLSSVYTLNLFDDDGNVASLAAIDEQQRTSYISSDDLSNGKHDEKPSEISRSEIKSTTISSPVAVSLPNVRLTPFALTKETTSLVELYDNNNDDNLDPEVQTLLSSVENLAHSTDAKKLSSFEEANALLQSFESLDQIIVGGVKDDDNNFAMVDDDDDDELLVSLYENVDEESKSCKSSPRKTAPYSDHPAPQSQNFVRSSVVDDSSSFSSAAKLPYKSSTIERSVKKIEKFTESDEEFQSRRTAAALVSLRNNDEYASSDSNSTTRSFGLKISDAIALFEKTNTNISNNNNNNKSNPSSRESSLGRSDGRKILASMTTTSSSQVNPPPRRPSGFVLVRTPSSYESADENELANSPLFRKQQNLLSGGDHPFGDGTTTNLEPLVSVESHHRGLTASSTSLTSAGGATVKSFHKSSSTVTSNGSNNLHLYYV